MSKSKYKKIKPRQIDKEKLEQALKDESDK